jgi:hypothetical protein
VRAFGSRLIGDRSLLSFQKIPVVFVTLYRFDMNESEIEPIQRLTALGSGRCLRDFKRKNAAVRSGLCFRESSRVTFGAALVNSMRALDSGSVGSWSHGGL